MIMFDSGFEMPPQPPQEEEVERKIVGLTGEELAQVADFIEERLKNPELGILAAAAAAHDEGDWDGLAEAMQKKGGGNFTGEELKTGLIGSGLLKDASEQYHAMQEEGKMDEAA